MKLSFDDLNHSYEALTVRVCCRGVSFQTELVGGQPASDDELAAFVTHHLGITDPEQAQQAVERIKLEELGVEVTPEEGEIPEKKVYGVRNLRRSELGPWIADWMIKAAMKQAASRIGIFKKFKNKGDLAEGGRVQAVGESLKEPEHPERIYVVLSAPTFFKEFMGRVRTPKGEASIIHHSECIPPGSSFNFEYRFLPGQLKESDVREILAMFMVVKLGSARSLERGQLRIQEAEITFPVKAKAKKEEEAGVAA